MKNLSTDLRSFLRKLSNKNHKSSKDSGLNLNQARLFCELYDVINYSARELRQSQMGKWVLVYNGEDPEALAITFKMTLSRKKEDPQILIRIDPLGVSFLEVSNISGQNSSIDINNQSQQSFLNSSAYKRYFAQHSHGLDQIKTIIPARQLMSRDLGAYLSHLFKVLEPFIASHVNEHSVKKAA